MTKKKKTTESIVKDIKRKIRIVLEGLKSEESVSGICRREGIAPALYYRWGKDFLAAGKKRLMGDTMHEANTDEVKGLKGGELPTQGSGGRTTLAEPCAEKKQD